LTQYALSEEQDRQRAKQEARARVLKDFERGLGLGTPGSGSVSAVKKDDKVELKSGHAADLARGTKRKFEFDQGAVERLAQEAEDAAMAEMEAEQVSQGSVARTPFGNSSLTGLFSLP
jgi:nitric oxide synthase-interacting protein